jgi:hypothetical protein
MSKTAVTEGESESNATESMKSPNKFDATEFDATESKIWRSSDWRCRDFSWRKRFGFSCDSTEPFPIYGGGVSLYNRERSDERERDFGKQM